MLWDAVGCCRILLDVVRCCWVLLHNVGCLNAVGCCYTSEFEAMSHLVEFEVSGLLQVHNSVLQNYFGTCMEGTVLAKWPEMQAN